MGYFLKSELVKGNLKMIVLPGQGIDVRNVSCSKSTREAYPVGTIFHTYSLTSVSGSYYRASYVSAVSGSSKLEAEYKKYLEMVSSIEVEETDDLGLHTEATETKAEPKEEVKKDPTLLETILGDSSFKAPTSKTDGFYVSKEDWSLLVRNIQKHVNTMIIGPTGCGKTSVVQEICKRLGKTLHIFDMGTMMDPISSLLGVHRLEKGASIFDYAKFTQVIKEPCVVLLDELSRAPLSAMNILFSCLDDRRNLNIEIACGSGEREIEVNPEVTFIATANVGAEYSGTNSMDRALVNRFFPIELGCIPAKEEEAVLCTRTGINKDVAQLIVKIANNIRSLCKKQEVSVSLSIRETLMVAELVSDGWALGNAMEMIYLPLYEGSKSDGERSTIYKTISSY